MAQEQDQPEDLKAFEAALASLTPRADRLQRERLMFLAGQALGEQNSQHVEIATADGTRSVPATLHRWRWPTAFAAMTAVAACLLVTLAVRPPQVVERVVERVVEVPAAAPEAALASGNRMHRDAAADGLLTPWARRSAEQPNGWPAYLWALLEQNSAAFSPAEGAGVRRLRDLEMAERFESSPAPSAVPADRGEVYAPSRPTSQRELLEELMRKPDARRSERPGSSLQSISPLGAKS